MTSILIYSKPDCCLCEQAKAVLRKVRESVPFDLKEINILDDENLLEKYSQQIPVVHINGRKAFKYRLDEKVLVKRLQQLGS